jgi:TRL-like protein family
MARLFLVMTLLLTVLIASGCGLLYTDIRLPRAYHSATPSDVKTHPADKIASGEACNQSILYLIAWGDASYAAAVARALSGEGDAILYDVKADIKATNILFGVYARICTIVTGKVARQ